MGLVACSGTMMACSFGAAPSSLQVLPMNKVMATGPPAANIMDNKPMLNILPFGMCMSMANPTVAAATAAALGVLTPMPCIPATAAPWTPMAPKVLVGSAPIVTLDSKLMCSYGGVIQFTAPAQVKVLAG